MIEITAPLLYNNDMKEEKKSTAEWRALLAKKEEEITVLQRQGDWLSQQLRLTRGQRFGASSEQTQVLSEQFCLFNEAETVASPEAAEPDLEQITYKRKKRKGKREAAFSGLPTEQAAGRRTDLPGVRRTAACVRAYRIAAGADVHSGSVQGCGTCPDRL